MLPKPDSLRLVLFGPDGQTVLGVGDSEPEGEDAEEGAEKERDAEKAQRAIGPMRLTPEMLQVAAGHQDLGQAFLRVVADAGIELSYDLKLAVIPPCFALDAQDGYEENDTFETAASLKDEPEQALHVCKNDQDWFRVKVKAGEDLFIDVVSGQDAETAAVPPLDVGLFELDGVTSVGDVEVLQTPQGMLYGVELRGATQDREILLKVTGLDDNQQGPYRILTYRYRSCEEGGDDRMEENDKKEEAKELPRGQGPTRHLRRCPADADFYTIKAQKGDQIVLGLKHDAIEEGGAPMAFRLWDETGTTLVVEGKVVEAAPPAVSPVQMALATQKLDEIEEDEEKIFILEVDDAADSARYYHIIPLDGDKAQPPPQEQEQEQEQDEDEDEDEGEEKKDEGEEGSDEDKKDQAEPSEEEEKEEARRANIEEILENLEESDDNFQLKKALEDVPERYIENDW